MQDMKVMLILQLTNGHMRNETPGARDAVNVLNKGSNIFYFQGTYHNLASYMLMSEASVTDLNTRISRSPVNEHYFRPNIIVKGSAAYSEDTWDWIKIGENVVLRGFKHCIRYL